MNSTEPLLGQLVENGVVVIRTSEGEKKVASVKGGFLSVSPDKITILADSAIWADEVDSADAESRVQSAENEHDKAQAESELRAVKRLQD